MEGGKCVLQAFRMEKTANRMQDWEVETAINFLSDKPRTFQQVGPYLLTDNLHLSSRDERNGVTTYDLKRTSKSPPEMLGPVPTHRLVADSLMVDARPSDWSLEVAERARTLPLNAEAICFLNHSGPLYTAYAVFLERNAGREPAAPEYLSSDDYSGSKECAICKNVVVDVDLIQNQALKLVWCLDCSPKYSALRKAHAAALRLRRHKLPMDAALAAAFEQQVAHLKGLGLRRTTSAERAQ